MGTRSPVESSIGFQCADKWQQGDGPGSFDGFVQGTLMFGTGSADSSWNDLPAFGDEKSQRFDVLVVDDQTAVCTESADLAAMENAFFLGGYFFPGV